MNVNKGWLLRRLMQVVGLGCVTGSALADCHFREGGPLHTVMPLLGASLTIGRDVPVGSEVYRQTFRVPGLTGIVCSPGIYQSTLVRALSSTPLPLTGWSGIPYAGRVYETGVAGVGVAVSVSGIALPYNQNRDNCGSGTEECYVAYQDQMAFDISFIKTADVRPGTIQGSSLPTMSQKWISSNTLDLQTVSLAGAIHIVSRTCDTPDVQVDLGSKQLSEFTGVGSATPWAEFAIHLLNCPAFHGFYQGTGPRWSSDGTVENLDSRTANKLRYRLDPVRPAVDSINGVLSVTPGAVGEAPSAEGVGIQIADGNSVPVSLGELRDSAIQTKAIEGGAYSIPLRARYLQTATEVTPGPANGAVVFLINYQ